MKEEEEKWPQIWQKLWKLKGSLREWASQGNERKSSAEWAQTQTANCRLVGNIFIRFASLIQIKEGTGGDGRSGQYLPFSLQLPANQQIRTVSTKKSQEQNFFLATHM